jgi:hypothetical protein
MAFGASLDHRLCTRQAIYICDADSPGQGMVPFAAQATGGGWPMSEENKHNIHYFESGTMRGLYEAMDEWQHKYGLRLLSLSVEKDRESYCCIALTNPTEVIIKSGYIEGGAYVSNGKLSVQT